MDYLGNILNLLYIMFKLLIEYYNKKNLEIPKNLSQLYSIFLLIYLKIKVNQT